MTPIRNLLSDAVRYGLAAGAVGIAGLASMSAFAQDATPAPTPDNTKAKNLDRVEVLGSRIKRAVDTEPTAPVTTLTRAEIEQTGLTSTFDVINHIAASDGSGLSTVTTQTNGSDGSTNVSLRNLGAQRTLVLVDGKRWPTDANGVVDLGSIPLAVIERIEVLKDGASAIYGSDAIAGVINIITRKKYDGAQVAWSYGETTKGDGEQNTEEATIGANGERSSAVVSISRAQQSAIFAGDRTISAYQHYGCQAALANFNTESAALQSIAGSQCGSGVPVWGRLFGFPTVGFTFSPTGQFLGATGMSLNHNAAGTSWAPGTQPDQFHHFNSTDRYNFSPINYLQQPATRNNLYMSGHFDINDSVQAYAQVSYTQRHSTQQIAPVPLEASSSGGDGPQWAFGVSPNNIFNPFKAQITTTLFRSLPVGPRIFTQDFNTLASVAGVQGTFTVADRSFDWDVYGQYNSQDSTKVSDNIINLFALQKALGPSFVDSTGFHCGAPGAVIVGCVPFNVFGGPNLGVGNQYLGSDGKMHTLTAADVQAMISYVSYSEVAHTAIRGINFGATFSGEIAPLPGGMLSFATGVEQRKTTADFNPDSLVAAGGSSDNFTTPTNGFTKVTEEYLELDAPLLKNVQWAKELELDAAVRRSDNTGGGQTSLPGVIPIPEQVTTNAGSPTTSKFSLRWKPIDDLLLRASYGGTFRAPSVNDLFAGGTENFPAAKDPCNVNQFGSLSAAAQAICKQQGVPAGGAPASAAGQVRQFGGGLPTLQPEKGHDFTYGLVWSPSWDVLKGFNFTADYWRITLDNALTTLSAQEILDDCYDDNISGDLDPSIKTPGSPLFCNPVSRIAAGAQPGSIQQLTLTELNLSRLYQTGIDFGLSYKYDTKSWGSFSAKSDTTYTMKSEDAALPGDPLGPSTVGAYFPNTPNWKWRSNLTLGWTRGDWDASWTMRYMSALQENEGCNQGVGTSAAALAAGVAPNDTPGLQSLICNHPDSYSNLPAPTGGPAPTPGNLLGGLGYNRLGAVTYHDLQVGWNAPWKAHLSIGARNIFGKEPPLVATSFANSFDASYDLPGGPFYYFQYRQDF